MKNKNGGAMAWQTHPTLKGKIYIPDAGPQNKKHPCPDCTACQFCSHERCALCRTIPPAVKINPSKRERNDPNRPNSTTT